MPKPYTYDDVLEYLQKVLDYLQDKSVDQWCTDNDIDPEALVKLAFIHQKAKPGNAVLSGFIVGFAMGKDIATEAETEQT